MMSNPIPLLAATVVTAVAMLALDLLWLGVFAVDFYGEALGPLKSDPVHWPAALMFYAFYVGVIVVHCVHRTANPREAARRGAELGFVCYTVYELTNWAVLTDWPAILVPVDIVWGVVLTGFVALAAKTVHVRLDARGS